MHENGVPEQVQIAISVDNPLNDKNQHFLPPWSGSRSPLFALLTKLHQIRIAITLLDWQVYGMGRLPQILPVPGIELAIHIRQLS